MRRAIAAVALLLVDLGAAATPTARAAASLKVSVEGVEKPSTGREPKLDTRASVAGSRRETLSLVLKLESPACERIEIGSSPLEVELYEMRPVRLERPSFEGARTGKHYDPLVVADRSRVCPEKGENHAWLWLDVTIPAGTRAGKHSLAISPKGGAPVSLDVEVWGHSLPPQPTVPVYMNVIPWFIVNGHHGGWHKDEALLGERYVRELLKHRIYPMNQHLAPLKLEGGIVSLGQGPGSFRAMTIDLLPKESKVFIPIEPRNPGHLSPGYLAAVERAVVENGLKGRAVSYLWDEPHGDELDRAAHAASIVKKHAPSVEVLVTTPPSIRFKSDVDLFVPVAEQFKARDHGKRPFWLYVSCMSHGCGEPPFVGKTSGAPDLVIDRPSVFARAFPWVLERVGAQAGLYFNTVEAYMRGGKDPWASTYLFTGNGDGTLFYPDRKNHGPVASIRLKLVRNGIQDVEYLREAAKRGMKAELEAFRKAIEGPTRFTSKLEELETIRKRIGEALNASEKRD